MATTRRQPTKGIEAFALIWTAWLYSQEWWRDELWREGAKPGTTFESTLHDYKTNFIPGGDANDIILQMRTWERHDVGTTPGFNGDIKRALRSIKVPVLYMPSETDLYFPVGDARYESAFIPNVTLKPIPSLWGHTAGAAPNRDRRQIPQRRDFTVFARKRLTRRSVHQRKHLIHRFAHPMRMPICSLNFSRPGTRHHRDNLVSVDQERTHILSRIVPLAKLDQRHRPSLQIWTLSL